MCPDNLTLVAPSRNSVTCLLTCVVRSVSTRLSVERKIFNCRKQLTVSFHTYLMFNTEMLTIMYIPAPPTCIQYIVNRSNMTR